MIIFLSPGIGLKNDMQQVNKYGAINKVIIVILHNK